MLIGNIIFCIMIFMIGTVFGSFFTLAVYRIPLGLDITHERSFCPNCNHKLEFKDLIPILSYLSLGGKCRYCGNKIRIRYLILEILSGTVFLICYLSYNMNFPFLEVEKIISFVFFVFFYITMVLIGGIDKENEMIEKKVLLFGILTQSVYILYLYIFQNVSMYRYGIYLIIMLLLFIIDTYFLKQKGKSLYFLQVLMLLDYVLMFVPFDIFFIVVILSVFFILIYGIYKKSYISTKEPKLRSRFLHSICFSFNGNNK